MTEQESQLEFLHREIRDRLTRLGSSVAWYRARHYRTQLSALFLSAGITVVAGLKLTLLPELVASNIVLVLGALATILAAVGAFFSPQKSWHLNAITYGKFRALEAKLDFAERAPDFLERESELVSNLFDEYQAILAEYNAEWQKLRQESM